ncbi:MAG: Cytosine/adenosine deaminase or related metal-dependent hydrolase [Thermodesulfobacteria bacterium]|nr:amidohydrolase family protein [Thermodesulfobacteriota bacterium]MCU4137915.1 Cytosine/adenosine deaminase or related metal-dependent hydrolase [Thermodesulfobacteriota bacterium]
MQEIQLQSYHHYIIRAKWIIPILSQPILDGAIEIKNKKIIRVGKFKEIFKESTFAKLIDFEETVILPALVNAHTHLELSALRSRLSPSSEGFISWVKNVIKLKQELSLVEIREFARLALDNLWRDGVGIIGDVGNTAITLDLLCKTSFYGYFFQEVLSFRGGYNLKELQIKAPSSNFKITYSAHAPYSVSPLLLQAIKSYNKKRKKLFCIHCAESTEEVEFLKKGEGPLLELLKERGQWNEDFVSPKVSPIKYLNSLNLLDENTLLIHVIHIDEEDLEILKKTRPKICVCLKSNLFIGVGFPKIKEFISAGLDVCIGTDSLASNDYLSVWEEMKTIYTYYPDISPGEILKMATFTGAKVFGFEKMGALLPGYYPNMLIVEIKDYLNEKPEDILRSLINAEKEIRFRFYV